jgi:hypothetical protein
VHERDNATRHGVIGISLAPVLDRGGKPGEIDAIQRLSHGLAAENQRRDLGVAALSDRQRNRFADEPVGVVESTLQVCAQ